MRKILLVLVVFFGLYGVSQAQTTYKIGYIDLQKVITSSKAGKSARAAMESELQRRENLLKNKANVLNQKEEEYNNQKALMDEEAKKRRLEDIKDKRKELNRLKEDYREELQKKDIELTQKILKELEGIIKEIGTRDGYSIILEKTASGIIFGGDEVNLTQKIIKAYDNSR